MSVARPCAERPGSRMSCVAWRPLSGKSTIRCWSMTLGDRVVVRLRHRDARSDFDLLGDGAHLQRRIDHRIAVHAKHDAVLHVGAEALGRGLHPVGADRQIGDGAAAVRSAGYDAAETGVGLGNPYFGRRNRGAARVLDHAGYLRCSRLLRICRGGKNQKQRTNPAL
jgi:hypothetical protein